MGLNGFADSKTIKERTEKIKRSAREKAQNGLLWADRNKEKLVVAIPVVVSGVSTVSKIVGKRLNLNKEQALKEKYCYDRSLGHYWALKRVLTNKEWVQIEARKRAGEKLADILSSMKVLK